MKDPKTIRIRKVVGAGVHTRAREDCVPVGGEGKGLLADARAIIEGAREGAYRAINAALVQRNWLLGKRIAEEELKGERAEYGRRVVKELAEALTEEFGKGFSVPALYQFVDFYRAFPILDTLCIKSGGLLGWSHYRTLLQVKNEEARNWYKEEAGAETWSVRTLQRNISSQYYERTLLSQSKGAVKAEMQRLTSPLQDRLEFIKNPVVAEFLGLAQRTDFTESDLETRILDNLGKFLMELGKGYSFVGRQHRIHTEKEDYFVDLVFYNYLLKCFVLVDLKTSKITHQDVGQMDMYVRMFDEKRRGEGDNPTLGVILCADTDSDVARYSVLKGSEQLFASKYKLMLPSEEELRAEIEAQKAIFEAQHWTHTEARRDRVTEGGKGITRRRGDAEDGTMCVREDGVEWGGSTKDAKGAKKKEKKLGWLDASCIRALLGIGPQDEASKLIREDARDWYYGDQGEYAWLASADVLREALAAKPDDSEDDCSYYRHWIPTEVKPVPVTNEARRLAKLILEEHRLPKDNEEDALDIAMAAAARAELFVSVNEANLANIRAYRKLAVTLCYRVHRWPRIATPGQLLMAEDLDPFVEEIHEFRDKDWKEWNGTLDGYFEHISKQGRQVREKYLAQCAACEAAGKAYCAEQARKRAAGVETMNHANRLEEVAE